MDPNGNADRLTVEPTPKEDWWRQIAPAIMQMKHIFYQSGKKKEEEEEKEGISDGKAHTEE